MATLPSADEIKSMTPMLRQFYEIKHQAADAILFFRMGDFYEIFGDDAEEVAPRLELVLTSRERGDKNRIPFCGVPHHSAKNYWLKLLRMGYKVALADQLEDPAEAKGIVRRGIIRVLTPGCIDELEGLDNDAPNYLMAVYEEPTRKAWVVAVADVSTGELRCGNFAGESGLAALVERFRPSELLVRRFYTDEARALLSGYLAHEKLSLSALPEAILRDKTHQQSLLQQVFGDAPFESQPCGAVAGGAELVAAMLNYYEGLYASLNSFLTIRPLTDPDTMILDETARRDLELFETVRRRQSEGSLFYELNATLSPMGARLLRYSMAHPFLDRARIAERQQGVERLMALGAQELKELRADLKSTPDLERLASRLLAKTAHPAELAKIRITLGKARDLNARLARYGAAKEGLFPAMSAGLERAAGALALLDQALAEQPTPLGQGLGVFREGYDSHFDEKRLMSQNGEAEIAAYEEKLRARSGIGSLKVKSHKTFGLLIEVTKSNLGKVPADFIRRQTMVNCERFVTVELQELGEVLSSATELAVSREAQLYDAFLDKLAAFKADYKAVAAALAHLDLLQSFAWKALDGRYTKPIHSTDGRLALLGSRHPVVERFVGRHEFVPNDIVIDGEKKHLLITGPNMAGKSTVMRQTAIAAIMHQIGSFIPAEKAVMPLFDRVFTRVGAADDLSRGQSTFMVEMAEAAHILRQATKQSLVILDEVGRGTSTQDGLAIASAILEELAQSVQCYSLFATHYHELVPLAENFPTVRLAQTEVVDDGKDIQFTHRLIDGASGSSFGLEVARLAGLPERVIQRALVYLEENQVRAGELPAPVAEATKPPVPAKPLGREGLGLEWPVQEMAGWSNLGEIRARLERVNVYKTTPLQALNILSDLKSLLDQGQQGSLFAEDVLNS